MLTSIRRWLSPPAFPDEEQTRIAKLLNPMLLAVISLMLLDAIVLYFVAPDTIPTLWINGVVIFCGIAMLFFMRRGYVRLAGWLLCGLLWPLTVYYIAISGGLHSPALGFLAAFIALAVTLFGPPGAIGFGALSVFALGGLYIAAHAGLIGSIEGTPTLERLFATNSINFLLLSTFMIVGGRSIHEALARTRQGERALDEHNRRLQDEISGRQLAQEALAQERKLLRTVIDHLPDNIYVKDGEGRFLLNNAESLRLLGVARQEELLGKTDFDFFPRERALQWHDEEQTVLRAGSPKLDVEEVQPWQTERRRWVVSSMIPYHDDQGQVVGMVGMNRDITERKEAEEKLRLSEERYRLIAENATDIITITTPELIRTYVSPACRRLLGYEPEELIGLSSYSLHHPDDAESVREAHLKVLASEETASVTYRFRCKDGHYTWLETTARSVRDPQTNVVQEIITVSRDVSERKQVEDRLRQSEERYRIISEIISDYAFSIRIEPDGTMIPEWITESFTRLTGYTTAELIEREAHQPYSLFHPDTQAQMADDMSRLMHGETTHNEYRFFTKSGEMGWLHLYRRPLWSEAEKRVVGYYAAAQDVTERKKAEQLLRDAEQRYRTVADFTYAMEYWVNTDNTVQYMSPSCERITGYTPGEFIQDGNLLRNIILPGDRSVWDEHVLLTGREPGAHSVQYRIVRRDGAVRWIDHVCQPITDQRGSYLGVRASNNDITERKRGEEAQQQYANRLKTLRQLDQAILAAESPQEVAHGATQYIRQLIPCDQTTIDVYDFTTSERIRLATEPLQAEPPLSRHALDLEWIQPLRTGTVVVISDLALQANPLPIMERLLGRGYHNIVRVPLMIRGDLIGSLNLLASTPDVFTEADVEIALEIANQLAIAIQQARLIETQREQRTLAEALRDTAAALTSTLDPEVVMVRILENAGRVVPHDWSDIALIEGDYVRIAYLRGWTPQEEARLKALRVSRNTASLRQMLETNTPVIIEDTYTYPGWIKVSPQIRAYAGAPIRVRGKIIGFLRLTSGQPGFFSPRQAEGLEAFADQAAVALENAQLYDELRRHAIDLEQRVAERTHDLQVAAEVSKQITTVLAQDELLSQLVERMVQEFNLEEMSVFLLDATTRTLRYVAGTQIPASQGELDRSASSFSIPPDVTLSADASRLTLPLIIRDQWLGVLELHPGPDQRFTPANVQILTSLAEQISIAVGNTQLFAEVQNARRESEILYRVSRAVNEATSYTGIVQALLDQIGSVNYNIALTIYENFDLEGATYAEIVAVAYANQMVVEPKSDRISIVRLNDDPASPIDIEDMDDALQVDDIIRTEYKRRGVQSVVGTNVALGEHVVGRISFYSYEVRKFTDSERRLVRGMGDLAAGAIERSRLFVQAEAAQKAAEQANRVKSQFLANMSHELRTPLNAILNFTAFVADGVFGPVNEEQADALQQSIFSGKHLLSLINDILDLTKIEVGLMDLFVQEVDINETLAATLSVATGLIKDKPLTLVTDVEKNLPHLFGDVRRIRQIFLNLISNAVKYTPHGSITVSAYHEDGAIHVMVADTGIGIAPEDQELVFESFKQVHQGLPETVGTGLGLPISRFFAEAHGGKVWLESAVGKGSTFHVALPVRTEAEAREHIAQYESSQLP